MTPQAQTSGPLDGKHVLLTQAFLASFGGSEVVTLELAEHFVGRGARVLVATHYAGEPIQAEFDRIPEVELFLSDDPELDRRLERVDLALAWIHHQIIPESLLRQRVRPPIVFNHLSASHPAEYSIMSEVETALASAILFNSEETMAAHLATGLFGSGHHPGMRVFPNPAPDAFAAVEHTPSARPRLLVVSNHLPEEVSVALQKVDEVMDVTIIGKQTSKGARPERVLPSQLESADAVVTIGKTVQYSLVAGTPVYCYDHFGGPGWLSATNLETARYHNFSGRGFERKPADQIAEELIDGLGRAAGDARGLRDRVTPEMLLSTQIAELERVIEPARDEHTLAETSIVQHLTLQAILRHLTRDWLNGRAREEALESSRQAARNELRAAEVARNDLQSASKKEHSERQRLIDELAELRAEHSRLSTERDDLVRSNDKLESSISQAVSRSIALEELLDEHRRSFSWRITEPLRFIRARIGRRRPSAPR